MKRSMSDLVKLYQSHYYLEDKGILPLICATIISNALNGDPVWLMIVGPSSGGKSELINTTLGIKIDGEQFVHQISTITENAFLSGQKGANGKETSLLKKIGFRGVIAMKDFTSILSLRPDTMNTVMAQLREIYDGHFVKATGTGDALEWGPGGKINLIAGTTEGIYEVQKKFDSLGPRWINYILKPQDPKITTRIALQNEANIIVIREEMREAVGEYCERMIKLIKEKSYDPTIPEEFQEELIDLAHFSTKARSPVSRDYRQEMTLAVSEEMPMRMTKQFLQLSRIFMTMHFDEHGTEGLSDEYRSTIFKCALDSIPKQLTLALEALAHYKTINTSGLAAKINYPTSAVRIWLQDLNVRGICHRNKKKSRDGNDTTADKWEINENFRILLEKYKGIKQLDEELEAVDNTGNDHYQSSGRPWQNTQIDYNPDDDPDRADLEKANAESISAEAERKALDFGPFND